MTLGHHEACRLRRSWPLETVALWCAVTLAACFPAVLGGQSPTLERLEPIGLPETLALTADLRWLDEDQLRLGVEEGGVYSWRIGDDEAVLEASLAGNDGYHRGFESYSRVGGSSSGSVAFAGGVFGVYLKSGDRFGTLKAIEIVGDVDRRGDRTAVVGLSRNEDGGWGDHISWLFEDGEPEPRNLLPTRDGGETMGYCWHAEVSVIRFISDERILVVPGLEPGVFVYDRSGELVESLATDTFTADAGCGLEPGKGFMLGDAAFTVGWLARRRVIDEALADGSGNIYFFVRHVPGGPGSIIMEPPESGPDSAYRATNPPLGRVCWDLVQTRAEELTATSTLPCAIESEFADTRLRADLRGERAVILLTGFPGALARPAELFKALIRPPES